MLENCEPRTSEETSIIISQQLVTSKVPSDLSSEIKINFNKMITHVGGEYTKY